MSFHRVAVVMAGGSGERFWPVSTPDRPKQFLNLSSADRSLLQDAVQRLQTNFANDDIFIATTGRLVEASRAECPAVPARNVFGEPTKRNTAGALIWSAANLMARFPDSWQEVTMAVVTADHRIAPADKFLSVVGSAMDLAENLRGLVTIGIAPTRPETGYGYIERGDPVGQGFLAVRFTEKPDAETAVRFLKSGQYYWNSGMFFWTVQAFIDQLEEAGVVTREFVKQLAAAISSESEEAAELFSQVKSESIDYALMERSERVYVVESAFEWDDLGAWDALTRSLPLDDSGNAIVGTARVVESEGCAVYNDMEGVEVCLLGCDDLAVVAANGKILVVPMPRAQDVRKLVEKT
ncbi:MAG: mannose-1-phosphate guanylyltransferase [Armatimonadetes bacterium]|nr:mannose-1-phosphate guanylyltransferase [Armatimonadota bacterium]